jgi:hypothetical protein
MKKLIYLSIGILQCMILRKPYAKSRHYKIMSASIHNFGRKPQPILCDPWILAKIGKTKIDSEQMIKYQDIKISNQNYELKP